MDTGRMSWNRAWPKALTPAASCRSDHGRKPGNAWRRLRGTCRLGFGLLAACVLLRPAEAADWPMYRHGPGRTAATEEQLPAELGLQWERRLPVLIESWLGEFPHLRFDGVYEPIVVGQTLILGSSDDDAVTALDTSTGERRWRYYANGPIRLAPCVANGKVYFGADDGFVYCVDIESGTLQWKFDTALSARKGFMEGRLGTISPVRGSPLALDGEVHVAAGIWSFEDSAFFTLDAGSGNLLRRQSGTRGQGYLAGAGQWLFLPNGRVAATRINRQTSQRGGGLGGWAGYWDHLVICSGDWAIRMGALQKFGSAPNGLVCKPGPGKDAICFYRPVIADDVIYYSAAKDITPREDKAGPEVGDIVACSLKVPALVEAVDAKGNPMLNRQKKPETKLVLKELWRLPKDAIVSALAEKRPPSAERAFVILEIKAGNRLYGYRGSTVFAIDLPTDDQPAKVSWTSTVLGTPGRMIAADGKLFVVTRLGRLYCFGPGESTPKRYPLEETSPAQQKDEWRAQAQAILDQSGVSDGYCLVLGLKSGRLIEELFHLSPLHIIAMDEDPEMVRRLREKLYYLADPHSEGEQRQETKNGTALIKTASVDVVPRRRRIALYEGNPKSFAFPAYMADLIVSEDATKVTDVPYIAESLFPVLRPYGGTLCLELPAATHEQLMDRLSHGEPIAQAALARQGNLTLLSRPGPLPGAADWTDEWADAANTLKSNDQVKFPLSMLWTGGRSARRNMYFDRHYVPPAPMVIDGRMFIAGPQRLVAIDIYTGRIQWEVRSKLFTAMTRGHGGCHAVGTSDGVYVSTRQSILRFEPKSGQLLSEFALPEAFAGGHVWGRARIWKDTLITAVRQSNYDAALLSLDRHSGEQRWELGARTSFSFVALGNGRVFAWDGSKGGSSKRKPSPADASAVSQERALNAFDARDGRLLWSTPTDAVVDWLCYSEPFDVLVASTKKRIHAYSGRTGKELWHRLGEGIGFRGHPGRVWQKVIIWHDWIIDQRGPGLAYDLRTGKQIKRAHPVTQKDVDWEFIRHGHHCNHGVASENLLTFRAGNATFVDLTTLGTGTFPGFRAGCTNSLTPAGGLLNCPMYAHLCVCGYEFYTSLAFAPTQESKTWTYRGNKLDFLTNKELGRVQRLGVNLNAPGERRSPNGTLWFGAGPPSRYSYSLKGLAPELQGARGFSLAQEDVRGDVLSWVVSSGYQGAGSVTVPLSADPNVPEEAYTVRLHFLEPDEIKKGERVFSVALQGQDVLTDFDVLAAAGATRTGIVKEVTGVLAGASLTCTLKAVQSVPLICGIEVIAEDAATIPPEVHDRVVEAPLGEPVHVSLSYFDVDGPGPYKFRIIRQPAKGTLSGDGPEVTYTAAPRALGTDSFSWLVNDGAVDSPEATVEVTILAPNVPAKAENGTLQAVAGKTATVQVAFSDPDEQPGLYRFETVEPPRHGTLTWLSGNEGAYTPAADYQGTDAFSWLVNDGADDSNVATVTIQVAPDVEAPAVAWIDSTGPKDSVKVVLTERVAKTDAEDIANYTVTPDVTIQKATLSADETSVLLTTSALKEQVDYTLAIKGLRDTAATPNAMKDGVKAAFNYSYVGNGLRAEYYNGTDFTGELIGERIDPKIEVDWRKRLPFKKMEFGVPYCVRWTGRLKADHSEEYMIYFFRGWEHNHNPVRIWVDGELLSNETYGSVRLQAGKAHELKIELSLVHIRYQPHGDYYSLRWSSLSTPKQTIPTSHLGTPRKQPESGK